MQEPPIQNWVLQIFSPFSSRYVSVSSQITYSSSVMLQIPLKGIVMSYKSISATCTFSLWGFICLFVYLLSVLLHIYLSINFLLEMWCKSSLGTKFSVIIFSSPLLFLSLLLPPALLASTADSWMMWAYPTSEAHFMSAEDLLQGCIFSRWWMAP